MTTPAAPFTWLITGGAGYIGAHVLRALQDSGRGVVVLDDLSGGHRDTVPAEVPFVQASILDQPTVLAALREHRVGGIVHLAAKKAVGESVERPLYYYEQNVEGTRRLLAAAEQAGVSRFVFSSSASVYGTPDSPLVTEASPTRPESPYGETKLASEWLVRAAGKAFPLGSVSLRYFNVAGAASPELGDRGSHNLVPLVLQALVEGRPAKVFGGDYPTPDGTCIRDYIHVVDLAEAHVAAAERLEADPSTAAVYNVGRGEGVSVLEVLDCVRAVTGLPLAHEIVARRPGDPAQVAASAELIAAELGWRARLSLEEMVASAWAARLRAAL